MFYTHQTYVSKRNLYLETKCVDRSADGLYTYRGSDQPEQTTDGRPGEHIFEDNDILNTATGVKIKRADNTKIIGETSKNGDRKARRRKWLFHVYTANLLSLLLAVASCNADTGDVPNVGYTDNTLPTPLVCAENGHVVRGRNGNGNGSGISPPWFRDVSYINPFEPSGNLKVPSNKPLPLLTPQTVQCNACFTYR